MSNAITGVMLTLGYLNEKNKFVAEPKIANSMESTHIRGVFIDKDVLSVAATEARTAAYGELSRTSSGMSTV